MRLPFALACLLAVGCARETKERPPPDAPPTRRAAPLPFPETAFEGTAFEGSASQGSAGDAGVGAGTEEVGVDRFATRRLGEPSGGGGEGRGRRYGGKPIDLDVKGADLHDVFRLIADVGRVNIVVAGEVTGTITLKLSRVPWDQALDVVARAKGLAVEREGNVIVVSKP